MSNGVLLDTCAILWLMRREPMAAAAIEAIDQVYREGGRVCVSPVNAWEIGMLASKGRVKLEEMPNTWFAKVLALPGIEMLPLTAEIMVMASYLPGELHPDPADRMLTASCRAHDLSLVTRDERLLAYAGQGHIQAIPC